MAHRSLNTGAELPDPDAAPPVPPFDGGGPFFRLLFRPPSSADQPLRIRAATMLALVSLTWAPPLLLSALEGHLSAAGANTIAFIGDLEVHIRLLLALPLLLLAELVMARRMPAILQQFSERKLIPPESQGAFDAAVSSAFRLRNSAIPELVVIAMVYGVGFLISWRAYLSLDAASWYAVSTADGSALTLAGAWYRYVSLPTFQFLLFRWYFRLFVLARFLWQVQRIKLNLIATHPDRVGGLGFLSGTVWALSAFAAAHGTMLVAHLATRILIGPSNILDFKVEIAAVVLFVCAIVICPLLVFSYQLYHVRRDGLRDYGALASRYVREFDDKWLRDRSASKEALLGSADLQSLADLNNSFGSIESMQMSIVGRWDAVQVLVVTLLPITPLTFTVISLEQWIAKLGSVLLK